jgi:arabinogalactan endo-1,4-beta-galactosidase
MMESIKKIIYACAFTFFLSFVCCGLDDTLPTGEPPIIYTPYALGADISLLTRYEEKGAVYQDEDGNDISVLPFFKSNGFNYVRYRLFVNPDLNSTACQDLNYVINLCKRSKAEGLKILLDFHYSDTWADPGSQTKPAAWMDLSTEQLIDELYNYTKLVLETMKAEGVMPDMIQAGNEITPGMLWNDGRVNLWEDKWNTNTQWTNFTNLLKSAIKAIREVGGRETKIIIHTERSGDATATQDFYNKMTQYEVDYDIVGLSYYPFWHGTLSDIEKTIAILKTYFSHKEVMFVEIAYPYNDYGYPADSNIAKPYPSTPEGQVRFAREFIQLISKHPNVTGFFYWFAEETCSPQWVHPDMHRGLFDNKTGKALPALKEFRHFLDNN